MAKIGKPVDKSEWAMTPPTVNAYYNPLENNINFPAGILQPPFFNKAADAPVNYGAAGAVVGHELTHGFDDQGRQFDARGQPERLVDARRRQGVRGARRLHRRRVLGLHGRGRRAPERKADARREHRRQRRPAPGADGADGGPEEQAPGRRRTASRPSSGCSSAGRRCGARTDARRRRACRRRPTRTRPAATASTASCRTCRSSRRRSAARRTRRWCGRTSAACGEMCQLRMAKMQPECRKRLRHSTFAICNYLRASVS